MARGRKTAIRVVLAPADRAGLEALLRAPQKTPAGLARRARLILLVADRLPLTQVAAAVGITRPHVYDWVRRYQAQGLPGLQDTHSGRPAGLGAGGGPSRKAAILARQFRYAVGTRVSWSAAPAHPWRVCWQRITYFDVSGTVVEYGLELIGEPQPDVVWVFEHDLVPWEDAPCPP